MSDYAELKARLSIKADMIQLGEKIEWGSDSAIMREAAALTAEVKRRKQAEEKLHYWLGEHDTVLAGRADEHDRADAARAAARAAAYVAAYAAAYVAENVAAYVANAAASATAEAAARAANAAARAANAAARADLIAALEAAQIKGE